MSVQQAGKQTKAFWRSAARLEARLAKEQTDYVTLQAALRAHAAGWLAGVAWARRNSKKPPRIGSLRLLGDGKTL
jgi:hypothetical protein